MKPPLMIELFCGTFGWSHGWLQMGGRSIGFDLEHLPHHGPVPAGAELVIQDVLTLHGSQFKDAALICASPPCQEYSYMAMPWSRSKAIVRALRGHGDFPTFYSGSRDLTALNALFDACFRIQREASEAAGRYIPLVVENVKGAQPWVGRAQANFGSYYLWGDVRRIGSRIVKAGPLEFGMAAVAAERAQKVPGFNFHQHENGQPGGSFQSAAVAGVKGPGGDWFANGRQGQDACLDAIKNNGGSWLGVAHNTESGVERNPVNGLDSFVWSKDSPLRNNNSHSDSRKAASALIARIPEPLARHIASVFWPS